MNPNEVVMHVMNCDGCDVVLNLFRERIRQASKSAHRHAHCEVLAFDVAGADVLRIGMSADALPLAANAFRRAIALLSLARFSVLFHEHCKIDFSAKGPIDRVQISSESIARKLDAIRQARRQIQHEIARRGRIAIADHPRTNQFSVGVHRYPRPNVTSMAECGTHWSNVLLLRANERPNFVNLDAITRQVYKGLAHVVRTCRAELYKQLRNSVFGNSGHANPRTDRIAFHQCSNHLRLLRLV